MFVERTEQSTNRKEEKDVLASRHLVRAVAGDGGCRDSDDVSIARGPEHNENTVDRCFDHVEGLSG